MYEDYDDGSEGGGGSSLGRLIALGVGVVAVALLGWFVVTHLTNKDGNGAVSQGSSPTTQVEATRATDRAPSGAKDGPTTTAPKDATTTSTAAPMTTAAPTT